MTVLVTGGAGYIGSHTCLELLQDEQDVLVLDNYVNSSKESLNRVMDITGRTLRVIEGDIRDRALLDQIFSKNDIESVVHFAGLKAVGESTQIPLDYFENNVSGTVTLLQAMKDAGVFNFVFSSSATVYGDPHTVPIVETFPLSVTNPYGRTKLMVEDICRDLAASDSRWKIALLRYFNPAGAHSSGRIGEQPNGIPNNLVPYISQVAIGQREFLSVFGDDYDTPDGTGVRDYLHVVDLAIGHLKALEKTRVQEGCVAYNLGTGQGYSVLDMVKAFEKAADRPIPYKITTRRPGDIACCYADPTFAEAELNWKAERGLEEMMADSWRWQSQNPNGYDPA
ncbi:UDP-glucose 4-epimerase GalE [Reinekea marinisedimentorum]|uniref:UDP-glucose 4-epimerase n=1 Tax=Reinekea marinisedimentorum TaxID=230495 RepID=A0A4R3I6K0_9GAMM|nr:UDP-glucose 4-epimerase GalE [Reinekea marinisedimentorum]TCS41596.1 UDP-glucose 4-epimerase [Reinekea marinisedimentorum]